MKEPICTAGAPAAIGPYSQGMKSKGMLITSGQLPLDPETGNMPGSVEEQTRQSLKNCQAVLRAGGADLGDVIKTTVFLSNMEHFSAMNAVYEEFFPENPPARSAVEVARLPKDALVEIECIAVV
ncbi:reactive intermediate/imine deaminase [Lachnospiraceae bacterium]|nr:reactive intermediate/imine deaminase [Lachnospiraceae bacterium]